MKLYLKPEILMKYKTRIKTLQQTLGYQGCDSLLVTNPIDILYLTGLELSSGKFLVDCKGGHLCVDGRYLELCKKHSPFPVILTDPPSFESLLSSKDFSHLNALGFDSEKTTYAQYESLQKMIKKIASKTRRLELIALESPLKLQRAIKDCDELQSLREAATLGSKGFDFICQLLKEGISEKECAIELEIFWKKLGSRSLAFDPIIAFGPNSSMPHYRAGNEKLKKGDVVLIDIGVNLKHYHSDMTRTVFFGKPDDRLLFIHSIVQKAQQAALALCRPGITLGELDKAARTVINDLGYKEQFSHSLGHGIGLDIHEYPTIKNTSPLANTPLIQGMVITIEPGIYLPGIGGVRIEDTIAVTENSYENLTMQGSGPSVLPSPQIITRHSLQ